MRPTSTISAARIAVDCNNGKLIAAGKSHLHPLDKYTTRDMVRLERENLTLVRDHMNRGRPIAGIAIRSAVDGQLSSTGDPRSPGMGSR